MEYTEKDYLHFFGLLTPLMDYMREQRPLTSRFRYPVNPTDETGLASEILDVTGSIWSDVSVIDRYLAAHPELSPEDREILRGWKRRKTGVFVIPIIKERRAIFVGEDKQVYLVRALHDPWEQILRSVPIPCGVQATLLPYKGFILYDGALRVAPRGIDPAAAKMFLKHCKTARARGWIQKTF